MPLPKEQGKYTYADYLSWGEGQRAEIIDGVRYVDGRECELIDGQPVMLAKPSIQHQRISRNLLMQFHLFLEGKQCEIFPEIDVLLSLEGEDTAEDVTNVFSPDLTLVCDKSKLKENFCLGAPDLVIEILSKSTMKNDRIVKYTKYQRAGVGEYWLVDPTSKTVQVFLLEKGVYLPVALYDENEIAKVNVLEGCFIELAKVFPKE